MNHDQFLLGHCQLMINIFRQYNYDLFYLKFVDYAKHDNVLLCDDLVADEKKSVKKVGPRLNVSVSRAQDSSPV